MMMSEELNGSPTRHYINYQPQLSYLTLWSVVYGQVLYRRFTFYMSREIVELTSRGGSGHLARWNKEHHPLSLI